MADSNETRARSDSSEVAFRKIFVGGLSYSTDEDKLKKYFNQYGAVQDAVVMKDPISKRSRGFGFITFVDVSSVDNALSNEPHTVDSRKVEAKRAVPRSEISRETSAGKPTGPVSKTGASHAASSGGTSSVGGKGSASSSTSTTTTKSTPVLSGQGSAAGGSGSSSSSSSSSSHHHSSTSQSSTGAASRGASGSSNSHSNSGGGSTDAKGNNMEDYAYNKIFVGGLHYGTRDAEFRSYFESYGKVVSAEVMFNRETHKSRGFGFIVFELEQSAVKVCAVKEHIIDDKVVEVKRAIPRSKLPAGTPTPSSNGGGYAGNSSNQSNSSSSSSSSNNSGVTANTGRGGASTSNPSSTSGSATRKSGSTAANSASSSNTTSSTSGSGSAESTSPPPAPISASRTVTGTSYAAALKLGTKTNNDNTTGSSASSNANNSSSARSPSAAGLIAGVTAPAPNISNSGMNLQSLIYAASSGIDLKRTQRSNSEPIVTGSSVLNGDILPYDAVLLSQPSAAGAITKVPSTASSRSGSIALLNGEPVSAVGTTGAVDGSTSVTGTPLANSILGGATTTSAEKSTGGSAADGTSGVKSPGSLSNLPWLASPPNNSLELTGAGEFGLALPPVSSAAAAGSAEATTVSSSSSVGVGGNHQQQTGLNELYAATSMPSTAVGVGGSAGGIAFGLGSPNNPQPPMGLWFNAMGSNSLTPQQQMQLQQQQQQQQQQVMQQQAFLAQNGFPAAGMMFMPPPPQQGTATGPGSGVNPFLAAPQQLQQQLQQQGDAGSQQQQALQSSQSSHQQQSAAAAAAAAVGQQKPPQSAAAGTGNVMPDMWAAMISNHEQQQQPQQQQADGHQQPAFAPFMMPPQFPFYPDGNFQANNPQQQQQQLQNLQQMNNMMFYPTQQQMQANFQSQMQQLQYQNQAQAVALAQAQAQVHAQQQQVAAAQAAQQQHQQQSQASQQTQLLAKPPGLPGVGASATNSAVSTGSDGSLTHNTGSLNYAAAAGGGGGGGGAASGASVAPLVKPTRSDGQSSEADDLFKFNDLNLDSPEFRPSSNTSSAWRGGNN